ncbi:MAG: Colicin receptor precursor [Pseudomonadota bacterium]|jgi:iron complex outermembrane receptor protein
MRPRARPASTRPGRAPVTLLLAAACAAMVSPPARGQTLDDVLVSSGRAEQRSFDAPSAVQAIDATTLREAGPQVNLSEALGRAPGIVVLNRQNHAQDLQLSIRGFGARATFGIRGVRLLVDGIPATMPDGQGQASTVALPSTDRIEVLRGPLAQLHGNASGGVVQAWTRDPPAVPEVGVQGWLGSFGTRREGLQAGGRSGAAGLVVDLSDFATDGWRAHGAATRRQLNAKLVTEVGDTRIDLVANAFRSPEALDPLGLTRAQWEADPRQAPAIAFAQNTRKRIDQDQVGVLLRQRLGGGDVLAARLYTGRRGIDQWLATTANGVVRLDRDYGGMGLQHAGERRVSGLLGGDGRLGWAVGLDYDRQAEDRRGYDNLAGVTGTALRRDERTTVASRGLYAQANWLALPDWTLTAGLRATEVSFATRDRLTSDGDGSGDRRLRATNPVIGLTWHAAETLNVYAQWGRGLETPTAAELAYAPGGTPTTIANRFNAGLEASRSVHREIGVKWRPDERQRIDLAVFSIDTRDELVPLFSSGGRTTFQNAGQTAREGLEAAWRARLTPQVSALASLTLLDASFVDAFARADGSGTVPAGNALPGTPRRLGFAELAWRASAAPREPTHVALELVHAAGLYVDDANADRTDGYTLANLRAAIGWRAGPWRLVLHGRVDNLADRRHVGSVIVNEASGRFFEPGPGRAWLVGASASLAF